MFYMYQVYLDEQNLGEMCLEMDHLPSQRDCGVFFYGLFCLFNMTLQSFLKEHKALRHTLGQNNRHSFLLPENGLFIPI